MHTQGSTKISFKYSDSNGYWIHRDWDELLDENQKKFKFLPILFGGRNSLRNLQKKFVTLSIKEG